MFDPEPLRKLQYCILRLTLRATGVGRFNPAQSPGEMLRSRFGAALKHAVCRSQGREVCRDGACLQPQSCPYPLLFKPQSGNRRVPSYVFEPSPRMPEVYVAGDQLVFHLILIGPGADFYPVAISAAARMARVRFGYAAADAIGRPSDSPWLLETVESVSGSRSPDALSLVYDGRREAFASLPVMRGYEDAERDAESLLADEIAGGQGVEISAGTPILLRPGNAGQIMEMTAPLFFGALAHRMSGLLRDLYGLDRTIGAEFVRHAAMERAAWTPVEPFADGVSATSDIFFWGRYHWTGEPDTLRWVLPLVILGEHLHIGKSTAFGLGKYVCSPVGMRSCSV